MAAFQSLKMVKAIASNNGCNQLIVDRLTKKINNNKTIVLSTTSWNSLY